MGRFFSIFGGTNSQQENIPYKLPEISTLSYDMKQLILLFKQKIGVGYYGIRESEIGDLEKPFITVEVQAAIDAFLHALEAQPSDLEWLEEIANILREDLVQIYNLCDPLNRRNIIAAILSYKKIEGKLGLQFTRPVYGNDHDAMETEVINELKFVRNSLGNAIKELDILKSTYGNSEQFAISLSDFITFTQRSLRLNKSFVSESRLTLNKYLPAEKKSTTELPLEI